MALQGGEDVEKFDDDQDRKLDDSSENKKEGLVRITFRFSFNFRFRVRVRVRVRVRHAIIT